MTETNRMPAPKPAKAVEPEAPASVKAEKKVTKKKVPAKKAAKVDKAAKKAAAKSAGKPMKVVATREGFYDQQRRMPGEKFEIEGEHKFSDSEAGGWMKKL